MDQLQIEVRRVVKRTQRMLRSDGLASTIRFYARLVAEHLEYPKLRKSRANASFRFKDVRLPYAYHLYGQTWRNERSLEIAIADHFLRMYSQARTLEVGNVLGHYGYRGHDVIDRYEDVEGVTNVDVLSFTPPEKYDTIISISTIEHVRFDEPEKDAHGPLRALGNLRAALSARGAMLVTVPMGYNPDLDNDIRSGDFSFREQLFYKRISQEGDWVEVTKEEALTCRYGEPYEAANAVMIGIDGEASAALTSGRDTSATEVA